MLNREFPLRLDIQFFARDKEEELHWYKQLRLDVVGGPYEKEVHAIMDELDALDGNETEEGIEKVRKLIEDADLTEALTTDLNRQLKVYELRADRSISKNFGSLVRHLRQAQGMSLRALQAKSGVTASYIQRIETGLKKSPSLGIVNRLSEALNQDLLAILDPSGGKRKQTVSLQELIIASSFEIKDKRANKEQKDAIVNIVNMILDLDFKENQGADAIALTYAVLDLKKKLEEQ